MFNPWCKHWRYFLESGFFNLKHLVRLFLGTNRWKSLIWEFFIHFSLNNELYPEVVIYYSSSESNCWHLKEEKCRNKWFRRPFGKYLAQTAKLWVGKSFLDNLCNQSFWSVLGHWKKCLLITGCVAVIVLNAQSAPLLATFAVLYNSCSAELCDMNPWKCRFCYSSVSWMEKSPLSMQRTAFFDLIWNRNLRDHIRSLFSLSEVITMHLFFFSPLNMDYNQSEKELQRSWMQSKIKEHAPGHCKWS